MHSLYGVTMLHITRKSLDLPPSTLQLQCYTDVQNKMIYCVHFLILNNVLHFVDVCNNFKTKKLCGIIYTFAEFFRTILNHIQ